MKEFKFSYDKENDDLFIYLPNSKSSGAVEIGDFVLDFDGKGNLVAIQILGAKKVFSMMLSRILELTKIEELRADIVNFRNMAMVKMEIITSNRTEKMNIAIPRIREESPALKY